MSNRGYQSANPRPDRSHFDDRGHRIPPRDRRPVHYDRPIHFYGHGPHFFGHRVLYLPTYTRVRYWGIDYYIHNGVYYRYYLDRYYVCRPPRGVFFSPSLYEMELVACQFAYYNSVYRTYSTIDSNYETIQRQNEIIAQNNALIEQQNALIAAQNETIAANASAAKTSAAPEIDLSALRAAASYKVASGLGLVQSFAAEGTDYYYNDGIFFVMGKDGQYEVILPPAGALIKELPDDYDTVTLSDGNEYYKVDDTIYRMTVVDGVAYFEVLGQIPSDTAKKYGITL